MPAPNPNPYARQDPLPIFAEPVAGCGAGCLVYVIIALVAGTQSYSILASLAAFMLAISITAAFRRGRQRPAGWREKRKAWQRSQSNRDDETDNP